MENVFFPSAGSVDTPLDAWIWGSGLGHGRGKGREKGREKGSNRYARTREQEMRAEQ